jgi:peptidoglycan hydrolase-like protein with peptidoglycan-binding domain
MNDEPSTDEMSLQELQSRLRDLGYYDGPMEGRPWRETTVALERFQKDHGLPISLRPDSATARALRDAVCF